MPVYSGEVREIERKLNTFENSMCGFLKDRENYQRADKFFCKLREHEKRINVSKDTTNATNESQTVHALSSDALSKASLETIVVNDWIPLRDQITDAKTEKNQAHKLLEGTFYSLYKNLEKVLVDMLAAFGLKVEYKPEEYHETVINTLSKGPEPLKTIYHETRDVLHAWRRARNTMKAGRSSWSYDGFDPLPKYDGPPMKAEDKRFEEQFELLCEVFTEAVEHLKISTGQSLRF